MRLFGTHGVWQGQERLDADAHHAVRRAEAASAARGLRRTTPDMLLLALLDDADGVPARALVAVGVDCAGVLVALDGAVPGSREPSPGRPPLDDAAREAVILGVNEARRAYFDQAGVGHLLLGILEAGTGAGVRALRRRGVRIETLREVVHELERAGGDRGAALFARAFASLLERIGGARRCPRCHAAVHLSFNACYNCGAALTPKSEPEDAVGGR